MDGSYVLRPSAGRSNSVDRPRIAYLAAGERLNARHALYALAPDDRSIPLMPPFWTVPILSPPLVAVIWRPLALLPTEVAVLLWWALWTAAMSTAVLLMPRVRPILASAAVVVLAVPIAFGLASGNLNGPVLLGLVAFWLLLRRGYEMQAGAVAGLLMVLKLTPAVVVIWLLLTGHRRAAMGALAAAAVAMMVAVLGAGIDSHLAYMDVVLRTHALGTTGLSLAGHLRATGLAPEVARFAPLAASGIGLLLAYRFRARPGPSFGIGVATMVCGSPVVNVEWFMLLLAAFAPAIWPLGGPRAFQPAAASGLRTAHAPSS